LKIISGSVTVYIFNFEIIICSKFINHYLIKIYLWTKWSIRFRKSSKHPKWLFTYLPPRSQDSSLMVISYTYMIKRPSIWSRQIDGGQFRKVSLWHFAFLQVFMLYEPHQSVIRYQILVKNFHQNGFRWTSAQKLVKCWNYPLYYVVCAVFAKQH